MTTKKPPKAAGEPVQGTSQHPSPAVMPRQPQPQPQPDVEKQDINMAMEVLGIAETLDAMSADLGKLVVIQQEAADAIDRLADIVERMADKYAA